MNKNNKMVKNHLKELIAEIDIASFFKNTYLNYEYDLKTNSFVKKGDNNPYTMNRFVFFKLNNNEYYFHFKTYSTGNLYELLINFDLPKIQNLSKYKIAIIILEKYIEKFNNKLTEEKNYTYFLENLNDNEIQTEFIPQFFKIKQNLILSSIDLFELDNPNLLVTISNNLAYLKEKPAFVLLKNINLIKDYFLIINNAILNNKAAKALIVFFDLNQIQKFKNLKSINKNIDTDKIIFVSLLKNTKSSTIEELKKLELKNYFLIADTNISNQYFNLKLILQNQPLFYRISKTKENIILEILDNNILNKKTISLSKMIKKFKAYNQKIQKIQKTYNLKKDLNIFSLNYIPTENKYIFKIPYEIETIELFLIYFIKLKLTTINVNIIKLK